MKAENLTKANKIQKSIHNLECLEKAIISKEGNRFAYLKDLEFINKALSIAFYVYFLFMYILYST